MKETNMEHYRGEIEKNEYSFAMVNGKLAKCYETSCVDCDFNTMRCVRAKTEWLMSPYKPEPVLTAREKHFVEFAQEGWAARDKLGYVYVYQEKPFKHEDIWSVKNVKASAVIAGLKGDMFPFITWEDEEAWSVEELRKLKVQE